MSARQKPSQKRKHTSPIFYRREIMTSANVLTIPAGAAFGDQLARGVIKRSGDDPLALAEVTILLPTRRAARALGESFARVLGGAALLPQMRPIGDVDEDELFFDPVSNDLDIPPAIEPVRRRLLLASLVQRWDRARHEGGRYGLAQAASLARGLAQFLDEVETQSADLSMLDDLADGGLAEHWAEVRDFLKHIRDVWPQLLASEAAIDPARRRNLALAATANSWRARPPSGLVIAAGTTGSIPATADLLDVIGRLPNGAVVLPGLDRELDEESWNALDAGHPQYGMKQLLERIGVRRADVHDWMPSQMAARAALLRETLRPAPTTDAWRAIADRGGDGLEEGMDGISLVEAANSGEEAMSVAIILREALETEGRTAALVTPDRNLGRRVAAELGRWNISIDDSAGRPLTHTPPGTFLALLAEAANEEFAPVPLLALLKHPLAAGGLAPAEFRRHARALDRFVLRGPRPDPGLRGIQKAIEGAQADAKDRERRMRLARIADWFSALSNSFKSFARTMSKRECSLGEIVAAHTASAECLAASDGESGANRLWRGQDGEAAADLIAELTRASADLPEVETSAYPALFAGFAEERAIRPVFGSHPRLAILGPLEARLQHFDLLVLGGLNEGSWPRAASVDPWLSRPMRKALGLESPERRIGQSAHDFATLAATPRLILTRALKSEGAPTVASRWIERLKQLTKGLGFSGKLESCTPYAAIAGSLDLPTRSPQAAKPPEPRPPVALRPRRLSVTEIENWLRDPYAIYAKHILKLRPLDPLDAEVGPLERGSVIHDILEQFLEEFPQHLPQNALARLIAIGDEKFSKAKIPMAALALWRPRFVRAARWFVLEEHKRRTRIVKSYTEIAGERAFDGPAGKFILRGRADRIDMMNEGGCAILDYKTGAPPSNSQVDTLLTPQLPLEGAILAEGGFAEIGKFFPTELVYVRFSGGPTPDEPRFYEGDVRELVRRAEELLLKRIADFDDPNMPYLSRTAPFRADTSGDYDHLARVREWSLSGWGDDAE
jgi:ATP-dependent helicase/nuclease subunit B